MNYYNYYWKKHKSDVSIDLPKKGIRSRYDLFREHMQNKSVLHIGCTDWPYTKEKIRNNGLLHQYLVDITGELYGIDTSVEGISVMQQSGITNILFSDIYNLHNEEELLSKSFDILLISEVVEHLTNPGLALESVRSYILTTKPGCEVILTVPNYHNLGKYFLLGLRNKEVVHPDHNFYFSYRTFRTLLERYNFEVNDFCFTYYYQHPESIKRAIAYRLLSHIAPCLAPYLYFKCRIS
jgi:2-polyprenyl-3-methyl-5-hydroxy-6-metoxy-1,4-benzoquinol methylase